MINFVFTACYNVEDKGELYNGTVNITESGRICQKWDKDTPHVHPLTSLYRLYLEGHNFCRNPEGRGVRPWCYTTDPTQRWEYCDVKLCRASESDDSDEEFPLVIVLAIIIPVLIGLSLILLIVILIFCFKEKARSAKLKTDGKDKNGVVDCLIRGTNFCYIYFCNFFEKEYALP